MEAPRQKKDDIERKRLIAKARLEAKRKEKEATQSGTMSKNTKLQSIGTMGLAGANALL